MVNSNKSNSPPLSEKKFVKTVLICSCFCMPPLPFTTEQTSQDKRSQTCMLHVQDIAG